LKKERDLKIYFLRLRRMVIEKLKDLVKEMLRLMDCILRLSIQESEYKYLILYK